MIKIADGLVNFVNAGPNKLLESPLVTDFLTFAFSDYSYPPDVYFYPEEIDKLKFTFSGAMKNENPLVNRALIGNFFIFHGLIREILFKSQEHWPNIDESAEFALKDIGGYIFHLFISPNMDELPDIPNNLDNITLEDRDLVPNEFILPEYGNQF